MDWKSIVGLIGSGIGITSFLWAGLRYLHRSVVDPVTRNVTEQLKPLIAELSHNGGTSVKDAVKRIEDKQSTTEAAVQGLAHQLTGVATEVTSISSALNSVVRRVEHLEDVPVGQDKGASHSTDTKPTTAV